MKRLLEIKNVSAGYVVDKKTNVVVADACLSLCGGQLVSLLGANGAGKSTLLRTIAGTQMPLLGEVLVDGKSLKSMSRKELAKMVSVVSTDRTQAGGLTVEELVGLGRQPHTGFLGRLDSSDREIVAEAMEAVGISHKAEKFVAELSDGERQKAMIARAVAQQTPVILLDEPTSFLDVASRVDVLQLLHRLAYNEGKAILLSSHDVSLSLSLSDRLWLLLPGGVIVDGQTEDLVLSGRLDELFLSRSVTFDMLTGEFAAVLPAGVLPAGHRSVALRCGDPSLSHWATNALLRSGYAVGDDGKVEVSVVSATDISVGGRRCSSFAGMLGALEVES